MTTFLWLPHLRLSPESDDFPNRLSEIWNLKNSHFYRIKTLNSYTLSLHNIGRKLQIMGGHCMQIAESAQRPLIFFMSKKTYYINVHIYLKKIKRTFFLCFFNSTKYGIHWKLIYYLQNPRKHCPPISKNILPQSKQIE